nr:MAG TPA: hypothetical protein [Caudoviricetes sp.]
MAIKAPESHVSGISVGISDSISQPYLANFEIIGNISTMPNGRS